MSGNNTEKRERIHFIDTAKGFCILLVVMFHTQVITGDTPLLGMLRMPFYFMLSGLFFKDYGGLKTVVKKINKLIIPFLFFYTVSYATYAIITKVAGAEIQLGYFSFLTSKVLVNIALWFLLALFWANMFFLILYKVSGNRIILGLLCISISSVGLYIFANDGIKLPLFLDSGLTVLPFFYLGYLLKSTDILYPNRLDKYIPVVIVGLLAVSAACFLLGDNPLIGFGSITIHSGNPYLFFIGAASIAVAFILLCKKLGPIKGIRYIGRYSLIILGVHMEVIMIIGLAAKQFDIQIPSLVLFIVSLSISVAMIPVLIKLFPKFTAQTDLIRDRWLDRFKLADYSLK